MIIFAGREKNRDMKFSSDFGVRAEKLGTGEVRVFRTIRATADGLGVTAAAVSHAIRTKGLCKGCIITRVPRFWVVKTTDGEYLVCKRAGDNYKVMGREKDMLMKDDVMVAREVTEGMWMED